ncbi:hypothetical protein F4V44_20355 [Niallia endozanthoxylica]|uniref:Uncharacterized protein n=2 Tax=Niallia endozanthoxylica TaxID=2036016 RepID=A0A5J5HBF3_9BACI|nr:hypothetical protein F4V44_20355 [Niallia endozanthoxylica]
MGIEDTNRQHRCEGCVCEQLDDLQTGTLVDVFLSGGAVFTGLTFVNFDDRTCCAFFTQTTAPGATLVLDCEKMQGIRIFG